jgi:hypothetical protein
MMKTACLLLFVLLAHLGGNAFAADSGALVAKEEVKRLILAVALLDYPIEQGKIRDALGIAKEVVPTWGGSGLDEDKRGTYWIWPLIRNDDGSYYALKAIYSADTKGTTGRYPLITSMEVVYFAPSLGYFVADSNEFPLTIVQRLKTKMKSSGLTPKEFTTHEALIKYFEEMRREQVMELRAQNKMKKPNQPPTPTSVTSPAVQETRQP